MSAPRSPRGAPCFVAKHLLRPLIGPRRWGDRSPLICELRRAQRFIHKSAPGRPWMRGALGAAAPVTPFGSGELQALKERDLGDGEAGFGSEKKFFSQVALDPSADSRPSPSNLVPTGPGPSQLEDRGPAPAHPQGPATNQGSASPDTHPHFRPATESLLGASPGTQVTRSYP